MIRDDPQECGAVRIDRDDSADVLLAAGFIRDFSAFLSGVVAAMELLKFGIHLLAEPELACSLRVPQGAV